MQFASKILACVICWAYHWLNDLMFRKGNPMKNLIVASLMILSTSSAYATAMDCRENVDHGYSVSISPDLSTAEVTMTTIVDSKVVANLVCDSDRVDNIILTCFESSNADAGYALVVTENELTGALGGTLSEITFAGSNPIAQMACF